MDRRRIFFALEFYHVLKIKVINQRCSLIHHEAPWPDVLNWPRSSVFGLSKNQIMLKRTYVRQFNILIFI